MQEKRYSIEVSELSKTYGSTKAINNLAFAIEPGEVVGFLGPNGAGKTTTMRILSGTLRANSGYAAINSIPVARYPEKIKRILSFMPESNPLPEDVRVMEYLKFRAHLKNIPHKLQKKRIEYALDACSLSRTTEKKLIRNLSKGYRQRVGIADCLLADPSVIIMDEPTIGLDPHQIIAIRKLIDSLRGQRTLLISSHILSEIEACCSQVIIINNGQIITQGTKNELSKKFNPNQTIKISVSLKKEDLTEKLKSIESKIELKNTTENNNHTTTEITTPNELNPTPEIIKILSTHLLEISQIEPTLEEIFITATKTKLSKSHKK